METVSAVLESRSWRRKLQYSSCRASWSGRAGAADNDRLGGIWVSEGPREERLSPVMNKLYILL